MDGQLDGLRCWLVPLGLAASFAANDGEELATMVASSRRTLGALPIGGRLRDRALRVDQRHVNAAIAMMGALCAAAVCDGIRTRGRGWLYQDFQWAFGLHGIGHIAASLATRGYTTGVATSPTVVLPQLWCAARALRRAGVPRTARPLRAAALVGGWLALSHAVGAAASAAGRRGA